MMSISQLKQTKFTGFLCAAALLAICVASFWIYSTPRWSIAKYQGQYAGSSSCRQCHVDAYNLWAKSNHGLAERSIQPEMDQAAFTPTRIFHHGSQSTTVQLTNGNYIITSLDLSGRPEPHRVARVIGNDPLRQFLVAAPGGRWQTMEASYDPHRNEWFDVFGNEDRQPGEWGHWTGRGMNWNSMCAACHNTGLQKNYDETSDSYHTTMVEPTVSCEACHGPLKAHVEWRSKSKYQGTNDPTMPQRTPAQIMDTCASCHSRRAELTGDFKPGDAFFDHFELTIVDHTEQFYPDGQVQDEDYEFTAFLGSKMHQAGVTCLDCHPASSHMSRPQGNAVCLRCHSSGYLKAPIIQPEEHSHHLAGGKGDDCIGCHMPMTVYMQRHPRQDHGFTIPDPLLTKKFGIPNACNRCHTDKDTDWSLAAVEKWYGPKMERPTRQRAEWMALARRGDDSAREPLLAMLAGPENPYWQAVAAGLLDQWIGDEKVNDALIKSLTHGDPLVRATAVRVLEPLVESPGSLAAGEVRKLLSDPSRNVRINAAWALRAELDTNSTVGRELLHYLDINADQPAGQMQKGAFYFARGDLSSSLEHFQKAVSWDTNSAPLHHEYAIALNAANRNEESIAELESACRLAPRDAEYFYDLGLAWNEAGNLTKTIEILETAVKLDPRLGRAWYNLGLARSSAGQDEPALEALAHAESFLPGDARVPYARATILARMRRNVEARTASAQALKLQPDFQEAAQLLHALSGEQ
jgi:tetratricopeptide (TPR) repeat protein